MSRKFSYRLHLAIGLGGFFSFFLAAFVAILVAMHKIYYMSDGSKNSGSFATASTSLAGFAIPVALTFLSYARQVTRCGERCPSEAGFFECINRIRLNPLSGEPNDGGR
jgi:hypothetical protein